ncbi:MAG: hypothetical protein A3H98_07740 [Bacteroidetes bacterium RIFCSPLOWO2_02_FULL_36_8]|nr:MAG: hypothetical protein A3H98_07740 [Bacteroidetes bacterium RIFCSPLOWO2_02_FULL_36_8]OFY69842.1 MAG: hypothetical protein A3G23_07410 [Bacteroidetes bacterium RIFCSPLOWO2_12_FULL_37_12]
MKKLIFIVCLITSPFITKSQSPTADEISQLIKSGDSKELSKFFNTTIELNFNDERKNYPKTQAELVLKNFFQKYPPIEFEYKHQGTSSEGLRYFIGSYKSKDAVFVTLIRMKPINGKYFIHKIEFTRE